MIAVLKEDSVNIIEAKHIIVVMSVKHKKQSDENDEDRARQITKCQ